MTSILIIKTGALGDVLRTTSILPGLHKREPGARVEWVTACGAADLIAGHPQLVCTHTLADGSATALEKLGNELAARPWDWVISLDDEWPLCKLATQLGAARLSGAYIDDAGERSYSLDVAAWFDMGLLSRHGKQQADRLKIENSRSQPEIYAQMLGIEMGQPQLELDAAHLAVGQALLAGRPAPWLWVGLNTGAGGRWTSKQLPVSRVIEFAAQLHGALDSQVGFVLLGGQEEAERNRDLLAGLREHRAGLTLVDGGTHNSLLEFAGIIDGLDLLLTSDSLALHMAIARNTPLVAFFAPTSAAEIELYGLGQKVISQAPDYCSYRPDADTSTLSPERLVAAARSVIDSNPTNR